MDSFRTPNLKIYSFAKNFLWKSSRLIHIVVGELLRLSDSLANQSVCWSDISRIQLKSNWTVGERLVASHQEVVRERRRNLHERKWTFLQCLISKIIHLVKNFSDGVVSLYTGYSGNSSDCPMTLRTDHFVDRTFRRSNCRPTEQLLKHSSPLINHTLIIQPNFTKRTIKHFWMPTLNIYSFAKNFLWKSSWPIHMVVRELLRCLDGLANQSFCRWVILRVELKSSWTVGERLLDLDQEEVREWRIKFT